ncbi:DODA-type extradiol aromatic ring-opening family dioxygenase, partial [Alteromonas abrolhosensis]|uniref:DODA-type extradiol aromatic ring-opening family dioxygenase n=1 Tax=Alteromonas abrolhosensis TaxID=1892904 RepID=UPI003BA9B73F
MRISTAYISHGGGPLPLLEMQLKCEGEAPSYHKEMIEVLETLATELPKPDAIIVVSAHWEERNVSVTTHPTPPLLYDYYGFPKEAYTLKYAAKGNVGLASSIVKNLAEQGISVRADTTRGFDHGMFIPLSIMYPNADVPCVQVSITSDLKAAEHIALGQALRAAIVVSAKGDDSLKHVLVLGSGSSFHNMNGFFDSSDNANEKATRFNNWLQTTMLTSTYDENERKAPSSERLRLRVPDLSVLPSGRERLTAYLLFVGTFHDKFPLKMSLKHVQRTYEKLGQEAPLYAVLS